MKHTERRKKRRKLHASLVERGIYHFITIYTQTHYTANMYDLLSHEICKRAGRLPSEEKRETIWKAMAASSENGELSFAANEIATSV
jgi:hypothetical protein